MPLSRCDTCGLIFARERAARDTTVCDPCRRRIGRGLRLSRPTFDPQDAPLFRALAQDRRRTEDPRFLFGQHAAGGDPDSTAV